MRAGSQVPLLMLLSLLGRVYTRKFSCIDNEIILQKISLKEISKETFRGRPLDLKEKILHINFQRRPHRESFLCKSTCKENLHRKLSGVDAALVFAFSDMSISFKSNIMALLFFTDFKDQVLAQSSFFMPQM